VTTQRRLLLAVPNISEGRDTDQVARIAGDDVLDVHSDMDHNRSVLTYGGEPERVRAALVAMIDRAVAELDITRHDGVHPRFGVVDVLPLVPYSLDDFDIVKLAGELIWDIAQGPGVPVYPYGLAGPDQRTLPELRKWLRTAEQPAHPTAGVICLGVRGPLVAFNVNLDTGLDEAREIARTIRCDEIRALAFPLPSRGLVQVSMNLVEPSVVGPRKAFERIARSRTTIVDCEVVGLVPDPVLHELASLPLRAQARSVEDALGRV
jgi:glutamate formiminotransferase